MCFLRIAVLLPLAIVTACAPAKAPTPAATIAPVMEPAVMVPVTEAPVAVVAAIRNEIQRATISDVPVAEPEIIAVDSQFNALAVRIITRWEVSGVAAYTSKWQGVIWPGGSSGPTWGIGYDGGHQTRLDIARDWAAHTDKVHLVGTSGVTGANAKRRVAEWSGVRTPYLFAATVFADASLPLYTATTRRAMGPGYEALPPGARAALVSLIYNRGGQTTGDRRREMRAIRDVCIPPQDVACIAEQLRSMTRLWPDVRGLRDRREDEARMAESTN